MANLIRFTAEDARDLLNQKHKLRVAQILKEIKNNCKLGFEKYKYTGTLSEDYIYCLQDMGYEVTVTKGDGFYSQDEIIISW